MDNPNNYDNYASAYSDASFLSKILSVASAAGHKVVYLALLCFYTLQSDSISNADRLKIIGALGYFILPTDLIPDFIPFAGYSDDLAALAWAVKSIYVNITPQVSQKAKSAADSLFCRNTDSDNRLQHLPDH